MNYRENGNILIVGVECKELSKVQNFQHLLYCVYHKYSAGRGAAGRSYAGGRRRWQGREVS